MAPSTFYVLAGPNGSGKTSFALNDPALKKVRFINADIEAQQISPDSPAKAALAAGRITLAKISSEISQRRTFALETTLSGLGTLETMRRAVSAGYEIDFTYLCLDTPSTNIGRVAKRVLAGGHHIPDRDVERRYHRSLRNLAAALAHVGRARVFDNSMPFTPKLLLEIRERSVIFLRQELPNWLLTAFRADATHDIESRLRELKGESE